MTNVFDVLKERGYIEQATHEEELRELLGKEAITFYIGFDATADSLTIGHFVQIMTMMHMQRAGHRPIVLLGGGTTMVGDPSGRDDMRQMMTRETIGKNAEKFRKQFERFLSFDDEKTLLVNNADWLLDLNYIDFLREVGRHFSVNRMLGAEAYKSRLDKGLTFLEFNYMLMQSYDYLELFRRYNCRLQLGGNDQWSNILSGYELVRKVEGESVFALTFKLLTTSDGVKMGKTAAGAIWLDPEKTSPYEFYQYLRNTDDRDVENFLALLTFLPMDEVRRLGALEGSEINRAKEVLAYEVTKIVHGEEEAKKAEDGAKTVFDGGRSTESMPTTEIERERLEEGVDILTLLVETKLVSSRSEGRRLVQQGGVSIEDEKSQDFARIITVDDFNKDKLMIKKGRRTYHLVKLI